MYRTRFASAAGAAVLGLALSFSAAAGPHAWTRSITTQRTPTGHIRDTTIVNARGQTATRHAQVSNDAATGTRTRNVDYSGFNGRTATRSVVAACDPAARSCTKTVTVNGGGR